MNTSYKVNTNNNYSIMKQWIIVMAFCLYYSAVKSKVKAA